MLLAAKITTRYIVIIFCAFLLHGCSTVDYMSNDALYDNYHAQEQKAAIIEKDKHRELVEAYLKPIKKPKQYGALHFRTDTSESEGKVFILKRYNGVYMAETKISESEEQASYLSFGVNKKKHSVQFGLRFTF